MSIAKQAYRRAYARVSKNPTLLFGVPFVVSIVAGSFLLAQLTQVRYTQHENRVRTLTQEEKLRLEKDRKRLDIREEYFKLESRGEDLENWEPKRVARPAGMPEWGGMPSAPEPGKEAVDEDLSANSRSSFFARRRPIEAEEAAQSDTTPIPAAMGNAKPVVLGPDGKPCRACNSKMAFSSAMKAMAVPAPSGSSASPPKEHTAKEAQTPHTQDACPPDVEELGRSTWTFLHSAAAYYPDTPSDVQRQSMRALIEALPHIYPCSMCADDLKAEYATAAFASDEARANAVQSGPQLRQWLCVLHNGVNAKLGKPVWDCSDTTRLTYRWLEPPDDREC